MKLTGLKTNHLTNPLGYAFTKPTVSFRVEETAGKQAKEARLVVATNEDFSNIVYDTGVMDGLVMAGTVLDFPLSPRTRYFWKASVTADNGDFAESETAWFETAKEGEPWEAKWICAPSLGSAQPVFKKTFTTEKEYENCRLYISGLGLYEAYLDGV